MNSKQRNFVVFALLVFAVVLHFIFCDWGYEGSGLIVGTGITREVRSTYWHDTQEWGLHAASLLPTAGSAVLLAIAFGVVTPLVLAIVAVVIALGELKEAKH
jgi:hypothetical protein